MLEESSRQVERHPQTQRIQILLNFFVHLLLALVNFDDDVLHQRKVLEGTLFNHVVNLPVAGERVHSCLPVLAVDVQLRVRVSQLQLLVLLTLFKSIAV